MQLRAASMCKHLRLNGEQGRIQQPPAFSKHLIPPDGLIATDDRTEMAGQDAAVQRGRLSTAAGSAPMRTPRNKAKSSSSGDHLHLCAPSERMASAGSRARISRPSTLWAQVRLQLRTSNTRCCELYSCTTWSFRQTGTWVRRIQSCPMCLRGRAGCGTARQRKALNHLWPAKLPNRIWPATWLGVASWLRTLAAHLTIGSFQGCKTLDSRRYPERRCTVRNKGEKGKRGFLAHRAPCLIHSSQCPRHATSPCVTSPFVFSFSF